MTATYTPDSGNPIHKVRLLVSDVDVDVADDGTDRASFQDEEYAVFLQLENGIKRAAALALETLAANMLQVSGDIKTQDLQTNASKTADGLLKRAAALRARADIDDDEAGDNGGFFVVDFDVHAGWFNGAELAP